MDRGANEIFQNYYFTNKVNSYPVKPRCIELYYAWRNIKQKTKNLQTRTMLFKTLVVVPLWVSFFVIVNKSRMIRGKRWQLKWYTECISCLFPWVIHLLHLKHLMKSKFMRITLIKLVCKNISPNDKIKF